ncbi:hypothetical protein [Erysipelothrix anatis]|uniref:hypothetical protein n=1 Tax=Erysipelothrix anatis TaxID=2683713 RepID=UPI001357D43A|nr:hypothetical protein [Erysipelothrix anatis]
MTYIKILMAVASVIFAILGVNQFYFGELPLSFISILGSVVCLVNIYLMMTTDPKLNKKSFTLRSDEFSQSKLNGPENNNGVNLDNYVFETSFESGSRKQINNTRKSNILFSSNVIGFIYFLYLFTYILTSAFTVNGNSFYDFGTAVGVALLIPHAITTLIALIFSFVGWYFSKKWASVTSGILYIVSMIFMPLYFPFVIIQTILSFIGAFKLDPRNTDGRVQNSNHKINTIANNTVVKIVLGIILTIVPIFLGMQAANANKENITSSTETSDKSIDTTSNNKPLALDEKNEQKTYGVGDSIIISENGKDLYSFTVNSVKTTSERNQFSEKEVEQVVVINYSYENIANPDDVYIFSSHFTVIDEGGNVSETYPAGTNVFPQNAPTGAKSQGEESYGLISSSSKITMYFKPTMFGDFKVKLELPVE